MRDKSHIITDDVSRWLSHHYFDTTIGRFEKLVRLPHEKAMDIRTERALEAVRLINALLKAGGAL